jgi:hypothetical protein
MSLFRRRARLIALAFALFGLAGAAQARLFDNSAAFKAAAGRVKETRFEDLVGTAEFPVNHPSAPAYVAIDHAISIDGFQFDGGSAEFGEENYLFAAGSNQGQYSIDGSGAAASGRTFVTLRTYGARSFGFDFGVDRVARSTFSLTFTFYLTDGSHVTVTRTGSSAGAQFLGHVGTPIDHIDIVNNTPMAGRFRPYFVFDNVLSGKGGKPGIGAR